MTTRRYEVNATSYATWIYLLKQEDYFSVAEWAEHRARLEWEIKAEVLQIAQDLHNYSDTAARWMQDFVVYLPENLLEDFESLKLGQTQAEIIKDFSFYIVKMERLGRLQGYLRELKQLD